jgi:hypothetical protein
MFDVSESQKKINWGRETNECLPISSIRMISEVQFDRSHAHPANGRSCFRARAFINTRKCTEWEE